MSVERLTRELGKEIQRAPSYLRYMEAKKANDADANVQMLMAKLTRLQEEYHAEASKETPDTDKMEACDREFQEVYTEIMTTPTMRVFEEAKQEIDDMMNYTVKLLGLVLQGEDPETAEPQPEFGGCTGSCSTCGGCG